MNKTKIKIVSILCAAVTALFLLIGSSCIVLINGLIHGNGILKKQVLSWSNFHAVSVGGDWTVDIRQSETFFITVEADENLSSYLDIYVSDHTLHIGFKHGYRIDNTHCKAFITMPILTQLTASGSITGTVSYFDMPGRTMSIDVAGSGDVTARDITVKNLKLKISGSGSFEATGKAQNMTAAISGSGNIKAVGLKTENTAISISGSGFAKVWVTTFLQADISGSGSIWYKGNPVIIPRISGSGRLYQL